MEDSLYKLTISNFAQLTPILQKAIYKDFQTLVYRNIFNIVKDHGETEDIIQESFFKAINNTPQFEDEKRLLAWLKIIAKNQAFNYLRKNKKNISELNLEVFLKNEKQINSAFSASLENEIETKILMEAIDNLVSQLKTEYRELIELSWKQQLSSKEVAAEIAVTENTVRQKLHRARVTIRKKLSEKWNFEE